MKFYYLKKGDWYYLKCKLADGDPIQIVRVDNREGAESLVTLFTRTPKAAELLKDYSEDVIKAGHKHGSGQKTHH